MGLFDFFKGNSGNSTLDLSDFKFISNDHIRFENGQDASGHNYDCWRGIRIQNNISDGPGFTVTIYNLDGNHSLWRDNIQMAPKQMKIESQDKSSIKLRGFGTDLLGNSFADYGLTINFINNTIENAKLHMYDRNIDIVYFYDTIRVTKNNELDKLILDSEQLLTSNDRDLIFKNVKKIINYFKRNNSELSNFKSEEVSKLEIIEQLAVKGTEYTPYAKYPFDTDTKQILAFTLIVINKICEISRNEKYVEDRLIFLTKQPSFMLSFLMVDVREEIQNLKLLKFDEDYFVKILDLLSSEILLTTFLKDRQTLLFTHSLQQLNSNYFYPMTDTTNLKIGINKVQTILNKALIKLL